MNNLQILKQFDFLKLWMAQILAIIAQNLLNFSLIILVYNLAAPTRFGNFAVSLVVLAFGLPSIFFATMAGRFADMWDRRLVMIAANLLRAVLVLLYLVIDDLWPILLLTFVVSIVMQFFIPAEAATIPRLVPRKLLLTANSLFVFSFYACFIIGYASSAPIIQLMGSEGPFIVTAVMFALAGLLVCLIPKRTASPSKAAPLSLSLFKQLRESWSFLKTRPRLRFAIAQLTVTQAIIAAIMALAPALSIALLHLPLEKSNRYLIIPVGVGMIVGVLLVTHVTKRLNKVRVLEGCLVAVGFGLVLLGLSGLLYRTYDGHSIVPWEVISWIVATLVFFLGVMNSLISTIAQTFLHENASDDMRGQVFGSLNLMINLAGTVPIFVTGLLADLLSVTQVVMILGVIVISFAFMQLWYLRRRRLIAAAQ